MNLIGIDVSEHNGVINWNLVKSEGVQFAMLRMGVGSNISTQDDKQFERNAIECERVGIKWGAYLYSYALTMDDVRSEVEHARRLLKGKKPTFPIVFDMEDADGYKKKHGFSSRDMMVNICDYFLQEMEKDGHYAMLYASLSWLNNQLNDPKLDRYDKWVAQWSTECSYKKVYRMWQHTSSGKIRGIGGNVDLNIAYSDFNFTKVVEVPLVHRVRPNENLTRIAQMHGTTIAEIMILNPDIRNPNVIQVGQIIKVRK